MPGIKLQLVLSNQYSKDCFLPTYTAEQFMAIFASFMPESGGQDSKDELKAEAAEMDGVEYDGEKTKYTAKKRCYAALCPARLKCYTPPANFGAVYRVDGETGIYRSAFPTAENLEFLASLELKTILTLVPEPYPDEYVSWVEKNGIRHIQIPIPANKEVVRVSQCQMSHALGVLLDRSNHPLLIHCNKGKHRTGCLVACFRKCQNDKPENYFLEYHTYAYPKARILDERFIEDFDERSVSWLARINGFVMPDEPEKVVEAVPERAFKRPRTVA